MIITLGDAPILIEIDMSDQNTGHRTSAQQVHDNPGSPEGTGVYGPRGLPPETTMVKANTEIPFEAHGPSDDSSRDPSDDIPYLWPAYHTVGSFMPRLPWLPLLPLLPFLSLWQEFSHEVVSH